MSSLSGNSSSASADTLLAPLCPVSRELPSLSLRCSLARLESSSEYLSPPPAVASSSASSLPFMMLNLSWKAARDHLGTLSRWRPAVRMRKVVREKCLSMFAAIVCDGLS